MLTLAAILTVFLGQTLSDQDASLIKLARSAVKAEVLGIPLPKPQSRSGAAAVFVTIERNGTVIGCRGDLKPRTQSVEDEVILEARGAAAHDPRYKPLHAGDLDKYLVTVTVVSALERVSTVDNIQPGDGLVLESGSRKGIVLPWEGKDPFVRLEWAYRKAGVPSGTSAVLYKLTATRCRG